MKKKIIGLFLITAIIFLIVFCFNSYIISKNEILGLWLNEENEKVIEFNNDNTFSYYSIDMSGKFELSREGSLTLLDDVKGEHTFKWDDRLPEKYENKSIPIIEIIYNWCFKENYIYLNGKKLHK